MLTRPDATLPPMSGNQFKALDFCLDRKCSAWFMPPGMGKTRTWLEAIKETQGRTLVIAPKLVAMDTWPRENKKWRYNFPMRFLHGREKHFRGQELVSLINYEALPWLMEKLQEQRTFPYEFVVFDESSKMKNPESKRWQAWARISERVKYKNGGTGTPVGAHLKDLFGEMGAVDDGRSLGSDYDRFKRNYFSYNEYTRQLEPYSDSEAEILARIAPRAISFDINDLDMPPIKHIPYYLDLPAAAREAYMEMHENYAVEDMELYAANAAVKSGKLRQMASGGVIDIHGERRKLHDAKAECLKQILEDAGGRPVMVFFEFYSDYQTICNVLGYEVPALYGRTKAREARGILQKWNAGKLPVLGLHPRSAAYGLNMQDSGNIVVWYTVPWSFEMVNQGNARVWRQGQVNKVMSYYLIVEDSEDERVYERIGERAATHDRVMEGLL